MKQVVRMCDLSFDAKLFETFRCGTPLDDLLSSHVGLPRGVNYMIIGDPGVGKKNKLLRVGALPLIKFGEYIGTLKGGEGDPVKADKVEHCSENVPPLRSRKAI